MRYVGRHRAPRPLYLRRPVLGGAAVAIALGGPALASGSLTGDTAPASSTQDRPGAATSPAPGESYIVVPTDPVTVPTDVPPPSIVADADDDPAVTPRRPTWTRTSTATDGTHPRPTGTSTRPGTTTPPPAPTTTKPRPADPDPPTTPAPDPTTPKPDPTPEPTPEPTAPAGGGSVSP